MSRKTKRQNRTRKNKYIKMKNKLERKKSCDQRTFIDVVLCFLEDENKCVKNFATDLWDIRLFLRIGMRFKFLVA